MRVDVMIEGPTIFIIVNREKSSWPYRIDNRSNVDVIVYQNQSKARYRIRRGQSMLYTWDEPAMKEKNLVVKINNEQRAVNIQEIGPLVPFTYEVMHLWSQLTCFLMSCRID